MSPGPRTAPRVEVGHAQLDLGRRQAGGVEPPGGRVADGVAGDHRQLAGAVRRQPPDAGALGDHVGHALGHRGGAPHDVAQRREVVVLEAGVVGHRQGDGGDRHLEGDAVAAMRRSTSSRSKRRCSRTVAPASAAASRLSRPRMCDGGVATWKRSSGPRPRAVHQWAVAWPIDRCVWRTALGSPVVPELNTRITSSASAASPAPPEPSPLAGGDRLAAPPRPPSAASSRSVTAAAPSRSESSAAAGPSAIGVAGRGQPEGVVDLDRLPRRAQQHGGRRRAC